MNGISVKTVLREAVKTLRHPGRVRSLIRTEELSAHLRRESIRDVVKESWSQADTAGNLRRRDYRNYDDYVAHQRDKLTRISAGKIAEYDRRYREALRDRLQKLDALTSGMSVLCLAARVGTEVKAFQDLGCFAVGIDLNPGADNAYVLPGDFHHVQFPDGCVDAVFSNSLDHAFDIEKLLGEIRRVLKPGGLLVVEAANGADEGLTPGFYESFWWGRVEDLIATLKSGGFTLQEKSSFDYPWVGVQLCLRASVPMCEARSGREMELVEAAV